MTLLASIKKARTRQSEKQPWPETPFATVGAIVQAFDLTSLEQLTAENNEVGGAAKGERLSLLPLLSASQYRLTLAILEHFNNPYLVYARTPVDIVISQKLFAKYPDLASTFLATTSLAAVWRQEQDCLSEP